MPDPTPSLEERARALRDAATSGPWHLKSGSTPDRPSRVIGFAEKGTHMEHAIEVNLRALKNLKFIAAAPTLITDLLSEVQRLTGALEQITAFEWDKNTDPRNWLPALEEIREIALAALPTEGTIND